MAHFSCLFSSLSFPDLLLIGQGEKEMDQTEIYMQGAGYCCKLKERGNFWEHFFFLRLGTYIHAYAQNENV